MKRSTPINTVSREWNTDTAERLQSCLDCTDWSVFMDSADSLDEAADTITAYIRFCVDSLIPSKKVKIYPNNKPWVSSELKQLLQDKRKAFIDVNNSSVKELQTKINRQITKFKHEYKCKLERDFQQNNSRASWRAMETITAYESKQKMADCNQDFADDLNLFDTRFDCNDFHDQNECLSKLCR